MAVFSDSIDAIRALADFFTGVGATVAMTDETASSGNQGNANAVATFAADANFLHHVTGFEVTASGATAGLAVTVTLTGLVGGTMSWTFTFPAGVLVGAAPLVVNFAKPVPATGKNVAVTLTLPASGAGGTNAAVVLRGFKKA